MKRNNDERFDYIRARIASFVDGLDETYTGSLSLQLPVLRGMLGKVEVTISDRQKE